MFVFNQDSVKRIWMGENCKSYKNETDMCMYIDMQRVCETVGPVEK